MSQTTGLSEDVVRLAMSEKNRGKNLQQLQREADKAKGKQMSQAEAMKKIADAILKLALVHENQGKHDQSVSELNKVIKKYPDTTAAQLAKQQLEGAA